MATLFALQEERAAKIREMRAVLDRCDGDELSAEDQELYEKIETDVTALDKRVEDAEAMKAKREKAAALDAEMKKAKEQKNKQELHDGDEKDEVQLSFYELLDRATCAGATRQEAYREAAKTLASTDLAHLQREATRSFLLGEVPMQDYAALQMDVDAGGGTMVPAQEFIARLVQGLDEMVHIRQVATVFPLIQAESLGVPTLEADPADSDWTGELLTGTDDTTMATGKRELRPHPLAKRLKVSKTLMRRSAVPVDQLVRERLGFKFSVTEEKAFLTGSGANEPLGIFTASADGISTGQDVNTDNATTDVTADGLINAKFNLASQYLASANLRWMFHRTVVRNIRKLKDGNGQYLWIAGLAGEPDSILEVPYIMSEYAPSTFTTGQYVGIIGDFQWFWIAESLNFELQSLKELAALTNQDHYVGRMEVDAMPVLEEAFTRVTLA